MEIAWYGTLCQSLASKVLKREASPDSISQDEEFYLSVNNWLMKRYKQLAVRQVDAPVGQGWGLSMDWLQCSYLENVWPL